MQNAMARYQPELDVLEQKAIENTNERAEIQRQIGDIRRKIYGEAADKYIGRYFKSTWGSDEMYYHVHEKEDDRTYLYSYFVIGNEKDFVLKPYLCKKASSETIYNMFSDYTEITEEEFEKACEVYKDTLMECISKIDEV